MEANEEPKDNDIGINSENKQEGEVALNPQNNSSDEPPSTLAVKMKFLLFGFSSLLAWSSFLTKLSFFNYFVPKLKPYESLSFLNFALNIVLQFIVLWKKDLFKLKHQLLFGLIGSIVFIVIIPLAMIFLKNYESLNIATTVILTLLMGLINAFCSSSFFALVSFFPLDMIISLSSGQGVSAILMNVIEYIILGTVDYGEDQEKTEIVGAIILFSVTFFILLATLITLLLSYNTEYFQYYLNKKDNAEENTVEPSVQLVNEEGVYINKTEIGFCQMFKLLRDIDLLCAFLYVVTFMLYPIGFSDMSLFSLDTKYYMNTILIMYNICDTAGRYLVKIMKTTKKITFIVILSRSILIFTIIINFALQKNDYSSAATGILTIVNVITFGITNGMGQTLCFGIAPTLVKDEYKGQAGASVSFFTIVGIFIGACLAFATGAIKDAIAEGAQNPS